MADVIVRYKGLSDERILPAKSLKKHGIGTDKDLKFNAGNSWQMRISGMTEEFEKILKNEGTFQISEISDKGKADVKVEATRSDDTAATVVDETTGQKSTKSS